MIGVSLKSNFVTNDIEYFIRNILDGIELANSMSCNYTLEISRNDVAYICDALKGVTNIEVS